MMVDPILTATSTCPVTWKPCTTCHFPGPCRRIPIPPIDFISPRYTPPATHFVGFRDDAETDRAQRIFGPPDFLHRVWDHRALHDIAIGYDRVIFARYHDQPPTPYSHDDSAQPDDPATFERRRS